MSNKISNKKVKPKRKVNATRVWALIVSGMLILAFIGLLSGVFVIYKLLQDKPVLNAADFEQVESSVVYDSRGEAIANLGSVIRQNIEYEEIPNCVVDAFVAIEDSRYFEHNGFDIPRFTKAILENLRTLSFGQGGSTFTMQLVKNTYFVNDETGENASRSGASGIKRKVQEIALAFELENAKSKQDIFESYVNKLNFGGSNNIRGIQKAAQYYFGKDLSECTMIEGALLAGVINAPNYYNPFYNLEAAQERVTEVLYQMRNHGYITQSEYELAKSVRIEDVLKDPYAKSNDGNGIPYQAYVDQVVNEVRDLTGLDPYTTTMHIYTYMNKDIQEEMDRIQAGDFEEGYLEYPDDYFEVASVCVNNTTGEVVGILGGRNYANGGQLLLNHATDQYKQPGSSIKPILDYALAFENLGWATDHVLTDKPMWLDASTGIPVVNDSGTYTGDVTLKEALGNSINTCAIQTLQAVLDAKKYEYVVNYAQSLGYDWTLEDFNIQYAMGGSTCEVTPYLHAGAYTAIMNYGTYTPPHTISRIEFTNGKSPITPKYESSQVISEAAAFLTTELMKSNVASFGGTYSYVRSYDYTVYGKTGTTDYGNSAVELGVPSGSIKDGWLVAATSEYTTATWVGYERVVANQPSYITKDFYYNDRPQGKIAHLILDAAYKYGNTPGKLEKPSGVTSITHVIGTWPYAAFTEGMDETLKTTGMIKSDAVKLVSLSDPKVADLSSFDASLDSSSGTITMKWASYPNENDTQEDTGVKDISLRNSSGDVIIAATGKSLFSYSKLYGPIKYMADINVSGSHSDSKHVQSDDNSDSTYIYVSPGDTVTVSGYYAYENGKNKSNTIDKTFNAKMEIWFPSAGSSLETLQNFVNRYDFVTLKQEETEDANLFKTFVIKDSNGASIDPGTPLILENAKSFIITYYVEKTYNLHLSKSISGSSVILRATYDKPNGTVSWNYPDVDELIFELDNSGMVCTVSYSGTAPQEEKDITVSVSADGLNDSETITIHTDGSIS